MMSNNISVIPTDSEKDCEVTLTLTKYVSPMPSFTLGVQFDVEVTDIFNLPVVSFTAEKDGKYVLKTAEGETNAWVHHVAWNEMFGDYSVVVAEDIFKGETAGYGSYTFDLKAGETIFFQVAPWDEVVPTTVKLIVAELVEKPTTDGWTNNY